MHTKVWSLIKYLLSMLAFLVVGVFSLLSGEELLFVVIKAIGSYLISTVVLGFFGSIFFALMEKNTPATFEAGAEEIIDAQMQAAKQDVDTYEYSDVQVPAESEKG